MSRSISASQDTHKLPFGHRGGEYKITVQCCLFYLCRRNLGGKLGSSITETLGVENMGELTRFSLAQLGQHFGEKTG